MIGTFFMHYVFMRYVRVRAPRLSPKHNAKATTIEIVIAIATANENGLKWIDIFFECIF